MFADIDYKSRGRLVAEVEELRELVDDVHAAFYHGELANYRDLLGDDLFGRIVNVVYDIHYWPVEVR